MQRDAIEFADDSPPRAVNWVLWLRTGLLGLVCGLELAMGWFGGAAAVPAVSAAQSAAQPVDVAALPPAPDFALAP